MSEQNAFPGDHTHVKPEDNKPADHFDQPKNDHYILKLFTWVLIAGVVIIGLFWLGAFFDEKKEEVKQQNEERMRVLEEEKIVEVTNSESEKQIIFMAEETIGDQKIVCWIKYIEKSKIDSSLDKEFCLLFTNQNTIDLKAAAKSFEREVSNEE